VKRYIAFALGYGLLGALAGVALAWSTQEVEGQTALITLDPNHHKKQPGAAVKATVPVEEVHSDVAS
jgi:hypothetical protein